MDQLDMFELTREVVLIKSIRLSEYLHSSIVKKNNRLYIKQETKNELFKNPNHRLYIAPSYSEICQKCFKRGYLSDLDRFGRCYIHGRDNQK